MSLVFSPNSHVKSSRDSRFTIELPAPSRCANTPEEDPQRSTPLFEKLKANLEFKPGMEMDKIIANTLMEMTKHDPAFKAALQAAIKAKSTPETFLLLAAQHGLIFDTRAFENGKLQQGKYPLLEVSGENRTPVVSALKTMFPDKRSEFGSLRLFYVRGMENNLGFTLGSVAAVDPEGAASMHKKLQDTMSEISKISPTILFARLSKEKFQESVEVNELAHLVLNKHYGFDSSDKRDWRGVSSGVAGFKIPNSQNVHEFISDCATALIPEGGIPLLYVKYLTDPAVPGYAYSHALLERHLDDICRRHRTTLGDLKKTYPSTTDQFAFLLGLTTAKDVAAIQDSFLRQSNVLLEEIRRKK